MAVSDSLREKIISEIEKIGTRSREMADYIFDNPELGEKEFNTQKYLTDELKRNGFSVETGTGTLANCFQGRVRFEKTRSGCCFHS